MGTTAEGKAARPLGVIGCLAAGFEVVGRHPWLITLPTLLDLFLWLGPRLSVAPLVRGLSAILRSQPVYDPEMVSRAEQAMELVEQFGEQFNLFSLLSSIPLLNLPSLLAGDAVVPSPLGEPYVLPVTSVLVLVAWCGILFPVGLVLGFLYLSGLAGRVQAMRPAQEPEAVVGESTPGVSTFYASLRSGLPKMAEGEGAEGVEVERPSPGRGRIGKFVRIFVFAAGLLAIGMALTPVWVVLTGLAMTVSQLLAEIVWIISVGLASYLVLHLLFVVHGVLLGGRGLLRAIWESAVMIHMHLPSVIVLLVIVVVVYEGLGYVWALPPGDSWLFLIGVLGNSCVATGLIAATFVFYRERVRVFPGAVQASGE
jgi:hypothetical protein